MNYLSTIFTVFVGKKHVLSFFCSLFFSFLMRKRKRERNAFHPFLHKLDYKTRSKTFFRFLREDDKK